MNSSLSWITKSLAFTVLVTACETTTGPAPFFQATFSLDALGGKALPLPDGSDLLLIGDSLDFNEIAKPRGELRRVIEATVVHRRTDGALEILRGEQSYERRGDTVITSFVCRFGELCAALVAAPQIGVFRNDSLVFSPGQFGVERVYLRVRR